MLFCSVLVFFFFGCERESKGFDFRMRSGDIDLEVVDHPHKVLGLGVPGVLRVPTKAGSERP